MFNIEVEKEKIDTPALLIDLDLLEKNLKTMSDFFKNKKAKLRAHTKVHRTPILAHKQIEYGAKGICCQKVAEAEVMIASGIKDVIVTNEIVTLEKINRLVALSDYAEISVPVDDISNAKLLSKVAFNKKKKLKVLIDIHMGSNRCGVEPGEPALKLAKQIHELEGLDLVGLMGFEGHISGIEPREKRRGEIEKLEGQLISTKELIEKSGIDIKEVSTGSTGTYNVSGEILGVTEVQAGTYILMDSGYHQHVPEFYCALSILSTVISKPSSDRFITDAGLMSMYAHNQLPKIVGPSNFKVISVHAENTIVKNVKSEKINIGEKIEFIPPYLDGTVKLFDKFYGIRKDKIETVWKISGRDTSN